MKTASLARKLKWLTLFRIVIVSFLFGATFIFNIEDTPTLLDHKSHRVLYYITTATYAVSFVYLFLLRVVRAEFSLLILTYVQLFGDVVLSAALVSITGGTESVFTFFFSLTIVNASIILYRRGALVTATSSALVFLLLSLGEVGVLPEWLRFVDELGPATLALGYEPVTMGTRFTVASRIYNLLINLVAFYSIAFLSSYLAEQVRRTSEEHAETRDSLEDLKALHHNIVSSIRSGLITITLDRRVSFFNEAAGELCGDRGSPVLGTDITQLFPALRHILENKDKHELLTIEMTTQMLGGRSTLLQWSISPLIDAAGTRTGQVLFVQDVTRMKDMEEQIKRAEQLAVIGELAARIAHEIRNPLASISGCIQMLEVSQDDEDTCKRLRGIVLREIDHLNLWINDFLEFSRPPRDDTRSVDLARMIKETADAFQHDEIMDQSKVMLEMDGAWFVKADSLRLKQVFWNLLRNSSQSMPFGGDIRVGLEMATYNGMDMVRATVSDQGVGIAEEHLSKIFEPFFTTKQGGTGLGLATCYRIIQEHGGAIEVESSEGTGSTFRVYLPNAGEA